RKDVRRPRFVDPVTVALVGKNRAEREEMPAESVGGPTQALPGSALPYCAEQTVPDLDPAMLRRAVRDADIRVLLMVVFQLSGDRKWLAPIYRPQRDVRLIADEDAGLSPEVQAEIRTAAIDLLTACAGQRPAISDPGDHL